MATKGQIKFMNRLIAGGNIGKSFEELSDQEASSMIGRAQAARGRSGALRIRPVGGPRRYGKNEKQRGSK